MRKATIKRTKWDTWDAKLRGNISIEIKLQVTGINSVVTETSLVLQARVEYMSFTDSDAGVEVVIKSSRRFIAAASGGLENGGVSTGLYLITIPGEPRVLFGEDVIKSHVEVVLTFLDLGLSQKVDRTVDPIAADVGKWPQFEEFQSQGIQPPLRNNVDWIA